MNPLAIMFILSVISILHISFLNPLKDVRKYALSYSVLIFLTSLFLWVGFNADAVGFQYNLVLGSFSGVTYHLGVDGISLWFNILTAFLIPFCILISWESVTYRVKEYYALFLLIEFLLFNVFSVLDLFLFYVFFEAILIPMFLVIGLWGSRQRKVEAAYKFFMYTLAGSILMLLSIIYLYLQFGSVHYFILSNEFSQLSLGIQYAVWLAFFLSFAVKLPMVPVHLWLPEAHVEAPTAGSVLLAGILLKMGGYGIMRFMLPFMSEANDFFTPFVYTMSLISIFYASLTTLRQIDLKKIIAYSSVAHMGYVTLGLFSHSISGIEGSCLLMLSHGFVSSGLFLCVGVVYDRYHTRILRYYGGLVQVMPLFATIMFLFILGNISFPGTSAFVAEFLVMLGVYGNNSLVSLLCAIATVFGAAYNLWLYNRIFFGPVNSFYKAYCDVNERELFLLVPVVLGMLLMGIFPNIFLDVMHTSVIAELI